MKTRLRHGVALIALTLLIPLAGCGDDDGGGDAAGGAEDTSEPYRVLMLTSLSGPSAEYGEAYRNAAQAAVDLANASGGADGHQIELEVKDDTGVPNEAVSVLQEAISATEYDLVIPGTATGLVNALLPLLADSESLVMSPTKAPIDPAENPLAFSATISAADQTTALFDQLESEGYGHVGLIAGDIPQNHETSTAFEAEAEERGLDFDVVFVPDGSVDATPQYQQLVASNPDVIVLTGGGDANFASILQARSIVGGDTPTVTDSSFAANDLVQAGFDDDDVEGILFQAVNYSVQGSEVSESPAMQDFLDELSKNDDLQAPVGILGYVVNGTSILLAAGAATEAGSTDPEDIAEFLESNDASAISSYFASSHGLYSPDDHFLDFQPDDFQYIEVEAAKVDGMLVPR